MRLSREPWFVPDRDFLGHQLLSELQVPDWQAWQELAKDKPGWRKMLKRARIWR
jgi:hypothetical protein